jgi:Alpha/beta hydrolase family
MKNPTDPSKKKQPPRAPPLALRVIKAGLRTTSRLSPYLAARMVDRLFFTPPKYPTSEEEQRALAEARHSVVSTRAGQLPVWRWGDGAPVLLMHGWGGRGIQLRPFIAPLVEAGFSVVTFDAPGHGMATGKRRSNLLLFTEALLAVGEHVGPLRAIISHSLGGSATGLALQRGLRCERAILISPPADQAYYFRRQLKWLGVPEGTIPYIEEDFQQRYGYRWEHFHLPTIARSMSIPALLLHDQSDPEISFEDSAAIAQVWTGASTFYTQGLGHRRIVREPEVIQRVTDFTVLAQNAA